MDFGLSRRVDKERAAKKRTNSTILNETDVILSGKDMPGSGACYSSPNSTNITEMNFTHSNTSKQNINSSLSNTINQSLDNSRGNLSRYEEVKEARIKTNEAYLNHLKSIDLKKYSFPNENKPKTDYTYARTTSYVSNSKTEDCPMPNLCRRSRISPPSNKLINFPFSSLTSSNSASKNQEKSRDYTENDDRSGFFSNIKDCFVKKTTTTVTTTTKRSLDASHNNSIDGMIYSTSATSLRPNRNIGPYFDEDDHVHMQANNFYANQRNIRTKGSFLRFLTWALLVLLLSVFVLFAMQQIEHKKEFTMDKEMFRDFEVFFRNDIVNPTVTHSKKLWTESNRAFTQFSKYLEASTSSSMKSALGLLERNFKSLNTFLTEKWSVYWPQVYQLSSQSFKALFEKTTELYQYLKQTVNATAQIVNTVEYKLPSFTHVQESSTEKNEIIKDYVLLKEKIFNEALDLVKNSLEKADLESMRKELDQKFNYTLSIMANKIVDQTMEIEKSQRNHENELKQMRKVLNELESRYTDSMEKLQEKLNIQNHKLEEQNQQLNNQQELQKKTSEMMMQNPELREELKTLIQSSHEQISFQKIEEYVNKTFYLYNADKTGMTDFASEAVGGSILFTRCTEVYTENSRWFTVFDVPISRLTVSPRVVIQGTVQPGNCWGFKGDKGDLFIKLAAKITPTSFSIEHIPKELSLTGVIDSAPQNFTVYGYSNVEEISDDNRLLLGNFRYDNNSKSTLQFFNAQKTYDNTPVRVIELKIESNAGNKDYTCLYKFRVHGKLFEKIQNEKNEASSSEVNGSN